MSLFEIAICTPIGRYKTSCGIHVLVNAEDRHDANIKCAKFLKSYSRNKYKNAISILLDLFENDPESLTWVTHEFSNPIDELKNKASLLDIDHSWCRINSLTHIDGIEVPSNHPRNTEFQFLKREIIYNAERINEIVENAESGQIIILDEFIPTFDHLLLYARYGIL